MHAGKVSWQSPANIALIKYWGKKTGQIPVNPSLSITLERSFTRTTVVFESHSSRRRPEITMFFENQPARDDFASKTTAFIYAMAGIFPALNCYKFSVYSCNSFPHSAGIASSASSMSALALCICSVLRQTGDLPATNDFFQTASYLARIGSGSACRSLYGGFCFWGKTSYLENSSDEFAVPLNHIVHPVFAEYGDAILVVSSRKKEISSSAGHEMMQRHHFSLGRIVQANERAKKLLQAIKSGREMDFVEIVENEALTLHALMMSSEPGYILMQPETISVINKIKIFRKELSIPVSFTIDAGPNVHLLYPLRYRKEVTDFIETELLPFCENRRWIDDFTGKGPIELSHEV